MAQPYTSHAYITVYAESAEDAEKRIETALRTLDGFDEVSFDATYCIADDEPTTEP